MTILNSEWGRALAQLMASSRHCKTQDALARRSGLAQSTIGRILRGEVDPQLGTMTSLARGLRVPFGTLAAVVAEGEKAVVVNDHHGESVAVEALDRVVAQLDDAADQLRRLQKEVR